MFRGHDMKKVTLNKIEENPLIKKIKLMFPNHDYYYCNAI